MASDGPSARDRLAMLRVDPDASLPMAAQLSEQLAWLIASGALRPGAQLPPVRSLADRLKINLHTVRSAYRQLETNGVVRLRRGVGTTVLPYDRLQGAHRAPNLPTFSIGVLIPGHNPFYNPLLDAVEQATRQSTMMSFVGNTQNDARLVSQYLDQLVAKNVDGVLVVSFGPTAFPEPAQFEQGLPPIVYADIPDAPPPRLVFDARAGGRLAAAHMLEHGHRRVGLITCPIEWANVRQVYQGFTAELERQGLQLEPHHMAVCPAFRPEAGQAAMDRLLEAADPPTAVFGAGSQLAIGAILSLRRHGLLVPEEMALISYNGSELDALMDPPLTSIELPAADMGRRAIAMLTDLIGGRPARPRSITLPVDLVIRRSCGCAG